MTWTKLALLAVTLGLTLLPPLALLDQQAAVSFERHAAYWCQAVLCVTWALAAAVGAAAARRRRGAHEPRRDPRAPPRRHARRAEQALRGSRSMEARPQAQRPWGCVRSLAARISPPLYLFRVNVV